MANYPIKLLKDETNAEDIEDWDSLAQITLISEMEKDEIRNNR